MDDHGQAVVEHELAVRDGDFLDERGDRSRLAVGATATAAGGGAVAVSIAGAVAQAASSEALASRMDRRRSTKRMKKLPNDRGRA